MALGDIGDIIEKREYYHAVTGTGLPCVTAAGLCVQGFSYNQSYEVRTWTIDPATGDISNAQLDQKTIAAGYLLNASPVFHIAGTIYGVITRQNYYYARITTFSVSSLGIITTPVAVYTWASASANYCDNKGSAVLHIAGTVYAMAGGYIESPYMYSRIRTWSISDDGLTISNITMSSYGVTPVQQFNSDLRKVAGNTYSLGLNYGVLNQQVRAYTISDAGAITYLGNFTLDDGGNTAARDIRLCKIAPGVMAAVYIHDDTIKRLATFALADDGTFGAVLDTDDTLYAFTGILQFYNVGGTAYMLTSGGTAGLEVKTLTIAADGTIGATIDTLAGVSGYSCYLVQVAGNMYVGAEQEGGAHNFHIFGLSVGVISGAGFTQGHIIG